MNFSSFNTLLRAATMISTSFSTILKQPKRIIVKRKDQHKLIKIMIYFRDPIDINDLTIKIKNNHKLKMLNDIINPVHIEYINNIFIATFDKQQLPVSSQYGSMKFIILLGDEKIITTNNFFVYSRVLKADK
jgi:hypothetical protein